MTMIFSIALIAQDNTRFYENSELIKLLPREAYGFLAWHDNNPDVKYWLVEVDKQTFENGVFTGEKTIWKQEVWKSNYIHIKDEYWNNPTLANTYYINLIGFDGDNAEIIRTRFNSDHEVGDPFQKSEYPPTNIERGCGWVSIGPNWAWLIQQWRLNDAMAFYRLENTTFTTESGEVAGVYWEYIGYTIFDNMRYNINGDREFWEQWYNITSDDWGPYDSQYSPNSPFRKIPNDFFYRDRDGNAMSGNEVIRVQKHKGWWSDLDGTIQHDIMTGDLSQSNTCTFNTQGAIDYFIQHSNIEEYFDPEDIPFTQILCCASGEISGIDTEDEECSGPWIDVDYNQDGELNGFDFWHFFVYGCESSAPDALDGLSFMIIDNISNPMSPNIEITGDEFFDDNGEFTPPTFTIEKGLNRMEVIMKGGKSRYIVFESKETIVSEYLLSDLLAVNIFPVPVIGDEFKMNIQSGATLDFTYELFDFNGNLLHKIDYSVKQGHNEDHKVRSDKPIPRGLLLNRFTFKDGSTKSITTSKN
ncbi:MAG: hypothetical protein DRI54_02685 [Bacteroidetes bacterium]|nr:MAG: hypothetical protein DRI54_02685 [Bacteroidota bacterium]